MKALEIARKLASLGQVEKACEAYALTLYQNAGTDPDVQMESAVYILRMGGNYKVAYTAFVDLYAKGHFQKECMEILTESFYEPNVALMKSRYKKNCRLLEKYPYLFRKDFLPFEDLPIRFYPFDDNSYLPLHVSEARFDGLFTPRRSVISRNFFKDLEKPVLAESVYSQYELEYLHDNVRKSEYVARENHIYLHYPNWAVFCAYLQVLNIKPLLEEKKIVFLIGDELSLYPIDFKERFKIDYSKYTVRPIGIREVNKLIWHAQLSSHNGGDFFNEILDAHPNLLSMPSVMFEHTRKVIGESLNLFKNADTLEKMMDLFEEGDYPPQLTELYNIRSELTDKDILVMMFLMQKDEHITFDPNARIVPAILFQPHFHNVVCSLHCGEDGRCTIESDIYEQIRESKLFDGFKYIKTFTPLRRFTTSHGATVKFMYHAMLEDVKKGAKLYMPDVLSQRILNRSFMLDPQDRLYRDCVLVRFEDGKLNPKATFTALAAFLDLPYTESMTYCSLWGKRDPESMEGNDIGFSTAAIYRTYDDYTNDNERYYLEYFLRDAYEYYGYSFHYYDGKPVDAAKLVELISGFGAGSDLIYQTLQTWVAEGSFTRKDGSAAGEDEKNKAITIFANEYLQKTNENRLKNGLTLLEGLRFVNKNGQPMQMMKMLQPTPELLEQPLYH